MVKRCNVFRLSPADLHYPHPCIITDLTALVKTVSSEIKISNMNYGYIVEEAIDRPPLSENSLLVEDLALLNEIRILLVPNGSCV